MSSKRTPRSTRTSAQTRAELASVLATPQTTPREREQQASDVNTARNATAGVSVETATKKINEANVAINKTLTQVTEQVVVATQQLSDLQRSIKVEEQELENLYGKGILAESLAGMIEEYQLKASELQKEHEALTAHLLEQRQAQVREHHEQDEIRTLARQRENDEYTYKTAMERRNGEDAFRQEMLNKRRAFETELGELKAHYDLREKALKASEDEFAALQKQVAEFPETLKKEVGASVAIATNSLKKDLTNQHALETKDLSTQLALARQNFDAATATVVSQQKTITQLEQRLADASAKVEGIANKALEAASGRQALSELQSVMAQRNEATGNSKQR